VPYTHFRLIGYEVDTASGTDTNPVIAGWDGGAECAAVARLPVPATLPTDARTRLKRLASVVDLAKTQVSAGGRTDNANTLKVFLAPEFYFRPPASIGADYKGGTYPQAISRQMLDALNQMFVAADFADWLFVCGTLMWNTLVDTTAEPLYFNTAVVVRGGQANALHVVEKRLPSTIDGVPQPTAPDKSTGAYAAPGYDPTVKLFFERWAQRKRRILDFDGIKFGLEVCLDHLNSPNCRVLRKVLVDWRSNSGWFASTPSVQLHLLSAGGMNVQRASVSAKANGYILRNDGMTYNDKGRLDPATSEMYQVLSYARPGFLGAIGWPAGPSDASSTANLGQAVTPQRVPIPAGAQRVPAPPGPYPSMAQQQLAFYPVTAVP
jgi:hypothetical protein